MTNRELVSELQGRRCRCGKEKNRSQTFCRACYFLLPEPMRKALYRRLGQGYEEAYQAAVDYFNRGAA